MADFDATLPGVWTGIRTQIVRRSRLLELVDRYTHPDYQLVLYSILTAASALAMVMAVPVFIGT